MATSASTFTPTSSSSSSSTFPPHSPAVRPAAFLAVHLVLARRLLVTHFDMDLNTTVPIKHLKEELATQLGLEASQQQWFYMNRLLSDHDTLETVGVVFDSIVEVRPMPGHAPSSFYPSAPAEVSAEAAVGGGDPQHSREV